MDPEQEGTLHPSITLGRVGGIPIGLHYSWIIIATLITLSLATHFHTSHPDWGTGGIWISAVFTALLFFATLVAHELSHALVARMFGLPVRSITLFALGGVAQIEKESGSAKAEFWIGIAGPITSFAIGFGCIAVAHMMGWTVQGDTYGPAAAILGWLGSINVILAVFNLVPGYPLDGGRILRAILWHLQGDVQRATRNASNVGQVVAVVFILLGLFGFLTGGGMGGLWLAFIGWFLLNAARASYAEVTITEQLRDVRAGDVMTRDCATVNAGTSLDALADLVRRTGQRCFMVTRDAGETIGMVTPQQVRAVARSRWPDVRVGEAMRPLQTLPSVSPATPMTEALQIMGREQLAQLPVMSDGHVAGIVDRDDVLRLVQRRMELEG